MSVASKVIISCAITGSVHTPTMSDHLPITPDEIVASAVEAAQAGAAILHLHARNPKTGRPTPDPEVFARFVPRIGEACDAVINITTGGAPGMTVPERLAAAERFAPELASLNMGPLSLGLYPLADRYEAWKQPWEQDYLRATRAIIFDNSFAVIEEIVRRLGEGCGTRFEFECYDIGHLYTLAHFLERGVVKPPLFVQSIFGLLGGIGAHPRHLLHMRETADTLFGADYRWSILAAGKHQMRLGAMGAMMGSNVRVGLEDSLYIARGELARSNAQQVEKIARILSELSLEIATPDEARAMLGLKGRDLVRY